MPPDKDHFNIGVISDTHGLLRPSALRALEGSRLILHAGDVGNERVLDGLRSLAPVHAVRGNADRGEWANGLPLSEVVEAGGLRIYLIHIIGDMDIDPAAAGIAAVVYGHTHRQAARVKDSVLYLNPGSAGPRRFGQPATLARLIVIAGRLEPEIIELPV